MFLGEVKGTLIATSKVESLKGIKFSIVQLLDENKQPVDSPVIAVDATSQAGLNELVFVVTGREAAVALENWFNPADYAIVGIVDELNTQKVDFKIPSLTN